MGHHCSLIVLAVTDRGQKGHYADRGSRPRCRPHAHGPRAAFCAQRGRRHARAARTRARARRQRCVPFPMLRVTHVKSTLRAVHDHDIGMRARGVSCQHVRYHAGTCDIIPARAISCRHVGYHAGTRCTMPARGVCAHLALQGSRRRLRHPLLPAGRAVLSHGVMRYGHEKTDSDTPRNNAAWQICTTGSDTL